MKNLISLIFLSLLGTFISLAKDKNPDQLLLEGNNYFKEKKYNLALACYREIENLGFSSPNLNYNLGTTYFKLDSIGKASLYLQRALKNKPFDEDIAFNLQLVNANTIDKMESFPRFFLLRWWDSFVSWLHPDYWAYLSIFLTIVSSFFLVMFWMASQPQRRSVYLVLFFVSVGIFLVSFCVSYAAYARTQQQNSFVVTANSANVHSAPTTNSTKLFMIHEGAAGEVLEEQPGWINARFPNGTKGWIRLQEIGKF
jgi:tetratricopeptide (TPR) repeat protein